MLEGCFSPLRQFSKFSEDFRRRPKTSKDYQKFRKLFGMLVFALSGTFS